MCYVRLLYMDRALQNHKAFVNIIWTMSAKILLQTLYETRWGVQEAEPKTLDVPFMLCYLGNNSTPMCLAVRRLPTWQLPGFIYMERESQRDRCGGRQVQRQTAIQIDGETRRTGTQLFKDSLAHNGRQDQSHTGMEMDRGIPDTHTHR